MELNANKGRAYVGPIDGVAKTKGWFFGAFMDDPLLRSSLVEVAWQKVPNMTPSADQAHFHRSSVEINVVLSGRISLSINGEHHEVGARECYVIWPESVVADLSSSDDTEVMVIRAPSLPDDKFQAS